MKARLLQAFLPALLLTAAPIAGAAEPAKLDPANTAWMITASVLVLFMTLPGLALFYAGLVRAKNVLSVLMQCFAITCAVTIAWVLVGYSIAFGDGNAWWGGLGKSFLGGGLIIGAAYYAQWKVTKDRLREFVLPGGDEIGVDFPNKHKVFGFGPDVTLPIATKSKLFALVNIRYLWESGAQLKTQGDTLVVTATFPVPSIKLN